ncbi:hypothetical protein R2F61_00910 [Mollicutes bacterium LVI A0078]|nr:hypothetical protein RZE84_00910 [Mollicutes bacterium LVI A0075]WOO91140.1 hypothetical protein R2F61_00910 [Mollicutes bacterium LVI A0078]
MEQKQFDEKVSRLNQVKMNSVSLIIIQLLIFITYTVKIVSEAFETEVTFQLSNNNYTDFGMGLLILSISFLVFTLAPIKAKIDLENEKQISLFTLVYKFKLSLYIVGYYLMILGIYAVGAIILYSIGFISIGLIVFMVAILSLIIFLLVKSLMEIVF